MTPRATYRVQFHKGFDFDAGARLAPYLKRLGVSHLYASPYLAAHPGSTHGYDIVDHDRFNPELGGEAGFARLATALAEAGLRHILDFVPNHMGVGGADNALWLDVLEWGEEAEHAGWFDIDWDTDRPDLKGKLLVPLLGDQYGVALEAGHLQLKFDAGDGSFAVWAHESHKLPVCPLHYDAILGEDNPTSARLGDAFSYLLRWKPQVMRRARELKDELAKAAKDPAVRTSIASAVSALNGRAGETASWNRLDALIARQNWKPTQYLVASDDINYRRFFNIATLAGLRMELPDVFDHSHRLALGLIREGRLDGLRIDHIDGLFDPKRYLERLREAAPEAASGGAPYLVVEKILGPGEPLRDDWPVDGTTGYDFTNLITGTFVHVENEGAFTRTYWRFTGAVQPYDSIVAASKRQIIDNEMLSELHRLARSAVRVARQNRRTSDFTATVLQRALRQIVTAFPVYRTYIDDRDEPTAEDLRRLDAAIRGARGADPSIDGSVFDFLRALLSGELARPGTGYRRSAVLRCAMKLQQYCGPVMAKGVEDTAFYRYNRFVALNEVGGSPERFGTPLAEFHDANRVRAARWPRAMLATSTHDTKRGEDTRARLAALSALPEEWDAALEGWSAVLAEEGRERGAGPDRNDEYLFYQLLVGTWPVAFLRDGTLDPAALEGYADRLRAAMTKSMREAKVHSTWIAPDEAYEEGALGLVTRALVGEAADRFLPLFRPFAARVAELGAAITFAQTALKLTVPGMPDIYQGAELWDLSMVDPDNRRPVDYASREAALDDVLGAMGADRGGTMRRLAAGWHDGRFKLALTATLLRLRAGHPNLFEAGDYAALPTPGDPSLCAFARTAGESALVVVARRHVSDPVPEGARLVLPGPLEGRAAVNVLTGDGPGGAVPLSVATLLDGLPAAVLLFA